MSLEGGDEAHDGLDEQIDDNDKGDQSQGHQQTDGVVGQPLLAYLHTVAEHSVILLADVGFAETVDVASSFTGLVLFDQSIDHECL